MSAHDLYRAYVAWRRANGGDAHPSVFGDYLRRQSVAAGLLDHVGHDSCAASGKIDGARLVSALQRRLSGQNESGVGARNGVTNGAEHGIDNARIAGVLGKAGSQINDHVCHDHGRRLFGDKGGLGSSCHVILRGLIARIRALLRGRVE